MGEKDPQATITNGVLDSSMGLIWDEERKTQVRIENSARWTHIMSSVSRPISYARFVIAFCSSHFFSL